MNRFLPSSNSAIKIIVDNKKNIPHKSKILRSKVKVILPPIFFVIYKDLNTANLGMLWVNLRALSIFFMVLRA